MEEWAARAAAEEEQGQLDQAIATLRMALTDAAGTCASVGDEIRGLQAEIVIRQWVSNLLRRQEKSEEARAELARALLCSEQVDALLPGWGLTSQLRAEFDAYG